MSDEDTTGGLACQFQSTKEKRVFYYLKKVLDGGRCLSIRDLISHIEKAEIIKCSSERNRERWVTTVKKLVASIKGAKIFYRYRSLYIYLPPRQNKSTSIHKGEFSKENNFKTTGKPVSDKLIFAVIRGRRPSYGFGRWWSRNDPEWTSLYDLHWSGCRVEFSPQHLYKTIKTVLKRNWPVEKIIKRYRELIIIEHGKASDAGVNDWSPSGIVSQFIY